jgi:hypothetical protein
MAEVTYEQALGRRERDWLLQQVDIRERGLRTDMLGSTDCTAAYVRAYRSRLDRLHQKWPRLELPQGRFSV